jgi:hypothetical protein
MFFYKKQLMLEKVIDEQSAEQNVHWIYGNSSLSNVRACQSYCAMQYLECTTSFPN